MISITKKIFGSEKDFVDFVNKQQISTETKKEIVSHEKDHFHKAVELGHNPMYGCIEIKTKIPFFKKRHTQRYFTMIKAERINLSHIRELAVATKNPSWPDKIVGGLCYKIF